MAPRETGVGVFAAAGLALVALPLVACGEVRRADGASGNDAGGRGGSSGSTGTGGSGDSKGSTGGLVGGSSAASAGSSGDAGMAGAGDADGAGGAGEERASFHWIEPTQEHRERAASTSKTASLRTFQLSPYDASVVIGTSQLVLNGSELYSEGIVWTESTGTIALGGLPGETPTSSFQLSEPRAISADGSVVVGLATIQQQGTRPFRWTRADGMEQLAEDGVPEAVSADGSVVVGVRALTPGLFRWTRALGAVAIFEPLAGDDSVRFLALSADGATVLGQSQQSDNASRLSVWSEDAGTSLIQNPPGYAWCVADVARFSSSRGFVAGGTCSSETGYEPFVWAGQDELVALGSADALDGYVPGSPVAVTDDGSVVVGSAVRGENESRVYRWTEATGFELIELPEGHTQSSPAPGGPASAMSNDGSVVVGVMGDTSSHSFLWSASAGVVLLSPLEGHDSTMVMVVSADGSVAAGDSRGIGGSEAVYWRADGVPHRLADELGADSGLGAGVLKSADALQSPLDFFGYGSKDEVSIHLAWRVRLP